VFHVTQANFPFYATKDVCLPIDELMKNERGAFTEADLYSQVLDGMRFKGRLFGLPSDMSPIVMLYNQDMFNECGVPYPREDWDLNQFLDVCKALTRDTNGNGEPDVYAIMNFSGTGPEQFRPAYNRWPAWVWMNGGDIFTPDMSRCVLDTPEAIGGMQFFVDLSLRHHVSPNPGENSGQTGQDLFASKRLAMIPDSRYVYKKFCAGKGRNGLPFRLLSPLGQVVRSQQPTFRWQTVPGAQSYKIFVTDADLNEVATSPALNATEWRITQPLKRGGIYSWQVTALRNGVAISSPVLPAPQAKFRILDRSTLDMMEQAERAEPHSHLTRGVLYAEAGMLDKAEEELQLLVRQNPRADIAHKLLRSVQAMRADHASSSGRG